MVAPGDEMNAHWLPCIMDAIWPVYTCELALIFVCNNKQSRRESEGFVEATEFEQPFLRISTLLGIRCLNEVKTRSLTNSAWASFESHNEIK